ncbi:MAG: hypothetical protein ACM4D3_18735 [Candidatus Sericytochromatia bacterium]
MDWDKDWAGRPVYYDRAGNPMTRQQWAQKLDDEDYRHIARDVIGPREPLDPAPLITVSTFWLGLNHDWRSEEPLIYETIIGGGEHDTTGMRYATESQAREGHRRVVDELRTAQHSPPRTPPLDPPATADNPTAEWHIPRISVTADPHRSHGRHAQHP